MEALNEDGTDASKAIQASLQELGATVDPELRQGHSHFVWSNSSPRVAMAAHLLDCMVVSPLWVEECARAKRRLPEKDYLVNIDRLKTATAHERRIEEPELEQRSGLSQPRRLLQGACANLKRLSGDSTTSEENSLDRIPLPKFREINLEEKRSEPSSSRRRSTRIPDSSSMEELLRSIRPVG